MGWVGGSGDEFKKKQYLKILKIKFSGEKINPERWHSPYSVSLGIIFPTSVNKNHFKVL